MQQAKDALTIGKLSDQRDLAKATNDLEIAQIDLELARQDLKRAKITSPMDGYVNKVEIVPGTVVGVNSVLTQVYRLNPIHARLDFPQERISEVALGQSAEVTLDGFPGRTFSGKVVHILPQINPELRVLPVLVALENAGDKIKAGLSGFARIRQKRKAIVAPAAAIVQQGDETVAFCVEGDRARMRKVRAGAILQTGQREIQDGLHPGDQVVIFHNFYRDAGKLENGGGYLQDNDRVDVDWRKWARRE
jgi:membrane fusion protein (multidrug efflux system)